MIDRRAGRTSPSLVERSKPTPRGTRDVSPPSPAIPSRRPESLESPGPVSPLEIRRLLTTYLVINTQDAGLGSLRRALTFATTPGDAIQFAIPGDGVHAITPASPLPATAPTIAVDGTSQPGYAGTPLVVIDGAGAGAGANGLHHSGRQSTIAGLSIINLAGAGI